MERDAVRGPVVAERRDVPVSVGMEGAAWRQRGKLFPPLSAVEHDAVCDPVDVDGRARAGWHAADVTRPLHSLRGRIEQTLLDGAAARLNFSQGRAAETTFVTSTSCCAKSAGLLKKEYYKRRWETGEALASMRLETEGQRHEGPSADRGRQTLPQRHSNILC